MLKDMGVDLFQQQRGNWQKLEKKFHGLCQYTKGRARVRVSGSVRNWREISNLHFRLEEKKNFLELIEK